jgi:predicted DNA-binding protein
VRLFSGKTAPGLVSPYTHEVKMLQPQKSSAPSLRAVSTSFARASLFPYLDGMEVNFTPETEKKLKDLATQSGRGTADELVQEVVEGYFDELGQTHEMLDSRYDDLKNGRVKPIPGDEVVAYFREKSAAARRSQPGS